MRVIVAREAASIGRSRIGDGRRAVGGDDVDIKVDEALAGDGPVDAAHTVRSVAGGAREAIVDVPGMFAETGVGHDLVRVVALCAKGEGSIYAEVRAGKEIGNGLAGSRSLAELITALEEVRPL